MCAYECVALAAWHTGQLDLCGTNYQAGVELAEIHLGVNDRITKHLAMATDSVLQVQ